MRGLLSNGIYIVRGGTEWSSPDYAQLRKFGGTPLAPGSSRTMRCAEFCGRGLRYYSAELKAQREAYRVDQPHSQFAEARRFEMEWGPSLEGAGNSTNSR